MQGNLKQISLPEVLQFISMGKNSGLLTVKGSGDLGTTLVIRQGKIINSSALERQRRLGDLLVHRGILKRSILGQVLALQRTIESDKRLGQILVERDIVQESQIRDVLRLQLEEEIWNLFGLEEGDFNLEQVSDDKLGEATVSIDIEPLILEGTRRQDEWRRILRILPNDRLVLGVRPQYGMDGREKVKLSPQEWKVIAQVNGKFPVRALINRAGMGRFEVYQILAEFLRRGVLEIITEEIRSQEAIAKSSISPAAATASKGVGGFLSSILSGGSRKEEKSDKLYFVTPVGTLTHLVNRFSAIIIQMREFKATPQDQAMVENIWNELLISFTKADLITVEKNVVNSEHCEMFFKLFEFGENIQDCYEDCLEGMLQLLDQLYRLMAQRAGERLATKTIRELLDEVAPRVSQTYGSDFKLTERVQMVLRLAA